MLDSNEIRRRQSLTLIRIALAALLTIHGWARFVSGGVAPFGQWLDGLGFPLGFWIAAAITVFEIIAPPIWAAGQWVRPLVLMHAAIYAVGIALVHWPAGWFVVGLGRNGMEYSVLLIVCLAALAWAHPPARRLNLNR